MTAWPLLLALAPLAAAAWFDGKTRSIPNSCIAVVFLCAVANVVIGCLAPLAALIGFVSIGAILLICAIGIGDGEAIGGGDVKLCAALGALVGVMDGLVVIATALIGMVIFTAFRPCKSLPLGPFMLLAYSVILILELIKCF